MSITGEERAALIAYRIEQAYNTFSDAEFAAYNKRWYTAANRLYYAAFYAASALLLSQGISFSTHKGLITQISFYFVKAEKITKEEGALIKQLFKLRHEADYEAYVELEEQQIMDYLKQTKELIDKLIKLNKYK